jgi:hypothetical protein
MPNSQRVHCIECGEHRDDVGAISWAGYCSTCGRRKRNENVDQMHARRGPNFNAWRIGMIRSAGGTVTDQRLLT